MVIIPLKIRLLQVRPIESADLTFSVPGILNARNLSLAKLGARVERFEIENIYEHLGDTVSGDVAKLSMSANRIRTILTPSSLFGVRNEALGASLVQILARRENEYLERFAHRDFIVERERVLYLGEQGATSDLDIPLPQIEGTKPSTKLGRLSALRRTVQERFDRLKNSYLQDNIELQKESIAVTTSTGEEVIDTHIRATGASTMPGKGTVAGPNNAQSTSTYEPSITEPLAWNSASGKFSTLMQSSPDFHSSRTVARHKDESGRPFTSETRSSNQPYRLPRHDNLIQLQQQMLAIQEHEHAEALYARILPNLRKIMDNELVMLDSEVRKLQLNYINTFLVSPIAGVVTAVFKDLGENVEPGEPVLRVENDNRLLLVGRVQCRSTLFLGDTAVLKISKLHEGGSSMEIADARIVSIRGHDSDDDEWEVVFECANPRDSKTRNLLPLNFKFDKDMLNAEIRRQD